MNFALKNFNRTLIFGAFGYFVTLIFLISNKYIGYALTHQSNRDNLRFLDKIVYIIKNTLTHEDFLLCLYGLVFMMFVGLLKNFER